MRRYNDFIAGYEWVSSVLWRTDANRHVVDDVTVSAYTTYISARVGTFRVNASFIECTIWVDDTFRMTG